MHAKLVSLHMSDIAVSNYHIIHIHVALI